MSLLSLSRLLVSEQLIKNQCHVGDSLKEIAEVLFLQLSFVICWTFSHMYTN